QQINVLLPVAGADYVGPLPGELQDYVLFSTGVLAVSKQVGAASAFQKFAAAPESAALLRKSGMEPWHGGPRSPAPDLPLVLSACADDNSWGLIASRMP